MTWPSVMLLALALSSDIDAAIAVGLKAARAFSSARARLVFGHLLLAPALPPGQARRRQAGRRRRL